jgi:multisubunit Na+/H+ antiporter MnhC subunit
LRSEFILYYGNNNQDNDGDKKPEKIGLKDVFAIAIAQLMILGPIVIGAILVFFLLLLFVSKVWLRG